MTSLDIDVRVRREDFELHAAFCVPSGATAVILGPNGSGKSTLLGAVAGLVPLQGGRVVAGAQVWDDADGTHVAPGARNCGFVFQDLRLFPALDVLDNAAFGLRARGLRRSAARAQALEVLRNVGAEDLATRRVTELSGGQRQRVALARALAIEPDVLLLDEALASLDARMQTEMRALLRSAGAAGGATRLVVTHDPAEAFGVADLFVVLERGALTWCGSPEELGSAPATGFLASLAGFNAVQGVVQRAEGITSVAGTGIVVVVPETDLPSGTRAVATFPPSAVTLASEPPHVSARNVYPTVVADVLLEGARARVRLDTTPPLHAAVTAAAVDHMQLRRGSSVWGLVKATEIRVEAL